MAAPTKTVGTGLPRAASHVIVKHSVRVACRCPVEAEYEQGVSA